MFDTHTHIQFKIFDSMIDQVIDEARRSGVRGIIAVATNLASSKKALELAQQFRGVYAAVGIHPHHVFDHFNSNVDLIDQLKKITELLNNPKVVAIGETGVDRHQYQKTKYLNYSVDNKFIEIQKQLFSLQIDLAIKFQKSLIIHNRQAVADLLEVLENKWSVELSRRSVFHCCEPDQKLLDFAIKHEVFVGIDGDITYDKDKQQYLKKVPLGLLVLETDSPFLIPESLKSSSEPNQPGNLKLVADKVAEILKEHPGKIADITYQNSRKLFNL